MRSLFRDQHGSLVFSSFGEMLTSHDLSGLFRSEMDSVYSVNLRHLTRNKLDLGLFLPISTNIVTIQTATFREDLIHIIRRKILLFFSLYDPNGVQILKCLGAQRGRS